MSQKRQVRTFGKTFIREWRKHRGLTLVAVSTKLADIYNYKATPATLSRIETRRQAYRQPLIEALAEMLDCSPGDLLERQPGQNNDLQNELATLTPEKRLQALGIVRLLKNSAA